MLVCRLNPQHVYPETYSQCPWCQQQEAPLNFPPPTQPAVSPAPLGPASAATPVPPPPVAAAAAPPAAPQPAPAAPALPPQAPITSPVPAPVSAPITSPVSAREPGKKRGLMAAIIATVTLAAVATGAVVWLVKGRSAPEPQGAAAPTASSSPAARETTQAASATPATTTQVATPTPSPSRTNLRLPEAPSAQLQAGAESRYSESYAAQVTGVSQDGLSLNVDFTATGPSDLRRPETSCLMIAGDDGQSYTARLADSALTTDTTGHFEGTLTFPALISGRYTFLYSCRTDYSAAEIGTVTVPSVGVSRFSEDYYAVVLGYDYTDLFFAAHGRSDLPSPETSCIEAYAGTYNPQVTIESQWSPADKTLVGKMSFIREAKYSTFRYSCADYTEVWVD